MKQMICEILSALGFDPIFLRMFREAYMPWGARKGDVNGTGSAGGGPAIFTDTQRATISNLSPGQPIMISNSAPLHYVFDQGPYNVTATGATYGKLLTAGEHVRIVPPGCSVLSVIGLTGDTTGGICDVQILPRITGKDIQF